MEIVIKLSKEDLATLAASGKLTTTPAVHAGPKKGRPAKTEETDDGENSGDGGAVEDDDDEAPAKPAKKAKTPVAEDDDDDEAPKPAKKAKPTPVDEDDTEDDDDEEIEEDDEDEENYVTGEQLAKVKAALTAFAKAKKSKDQAVKVLHKFAKSSEKVKTEDYKKLLAALKV